MKISLHNQQNSLPHVSLSQILDGTALLALSFLLSVLTFRYLGNPLWLSAIFAAAFCLGTLLCYSCIAGKRNAKLRKKVQDLAYELWLQDAILYHSFDDYCTFLYNLLEAEGFQIENQASNIILARLDDIVYQIILVRRHTSGVLSADTLVSLLDDSRQEDLDHLIVAVNCPAAPNITEYQSKLTNLHVHLWDRGVLAEKSIRCGYNAKPEGIEDYYRPAKRQLQPSKGRRSIFSGLPTILKFSLASGLLFLASYFTPLSTWYRIMSAALLCAGIVSFAMLQYRIRKETQQSVQS